jgi:DNA polymerase III delta prime subunit
MENSSLQTLNSILKFSEELSEKLVIFFTTNNENKVLSTIKSRCNLIRVLKDEEFLKSIKNEFNVEDSD